VLIDAETITVHQPTEGALIEAEIESERNCTFFTNETGTANYGNKLGEAGDLATDKLGRVVVYIDTVCEEQAEIHFYAQYPNLPGSLREGLEEWVGINWTSIEVAKQPQIRWAGEEIVLAKRWALPDEWWPNADEPVCPLAGYLVEQVRRKVRSVTGGQPVEVVLTDELWSWNDAAPRLLWGDGI